MASEARSDPLETRVHRLEDAVASLQDTGPLEERIVQRVSTRLNETHLVGIGDVSGSRGRLLPTTIDYLHSKAALVQQTVRTPHRLLPGVWLLMDVCSEARIIAKMYFDRRYQMTWIGRLVPPLMLIAIVTSGVWVFLFPGMALIYSPIATLINKWLDLVLAFIAFVVASREARRYREAVAGPSSMHSP